MHSFRNCIGISILALVAGSVTCPAAQAGQSSSHGPAPFSEFDQDGSGYVNEQEFNTTRGQRMAARAAEGKQMRGAASAPAFADIDTDGDGLLSPDELSAAQKAHMEQMRKGRHKGEHKGKNKSN